jgi:hypothetical protein
MAGMWVCYNCVVEMHEMGGAGGLGAFWDAVWEAINWKWQAVRTRREDLFIFAMATSNQQPGCSKTTTNNLDPASDGPALLPRSFCYHTAACLASDIKSWTELSSIALPLSRSIREQKKKTTRGAFHRSVKQEIIFPDGFQLWKTNMVDLCSAFPRPLQPHLGKRFAIHATFHVP